MFITDINCPQWRKLNSYNSNTLVESQARLSSTTHSLRLFPFQEEVLAKTDQTQVGVFLQHVENTFLTARLNG